MKLVKLREPISPTKLTVVFLHVGPKVSFFYTVGKCAIPNVLTLFASCHVHANLKKEKKNNVATIAGDLVSFRNAQNK